MSLQSPILKQKALCDIGQHSNTANYKKELGQREALSVWIGSAVKA